jgi:hypothetical protein
VSAGQHSVLWLYWFYPDNPGYSPCLDYAILCFLCHITYIIYSQVFRIGADKIIWIAYIFSRKTNRKQYEEMQIFTSRDIFCPFLGWLLMLRLPQTRTAIQRQPTLKHATFFHISITTESLCVCVILRFELRAYTLSHSTSPFCEGFFSRYGLTNYLPGAGFEPRSSWFLTPE